jgi:hypothetical protein
MRPGAVTRVGGMKKAASPLSASADAVAARLRKDALAAVTAPRAGRPLAQPLAATSDSARSAARREHSARCWRNAGKACAPTAWATRQRSGDGSRRRDGYSFAIHISRYHRYLVTTGSGTAHH